MESRVQLCSKAYAAARDRIQECRVEINLYAEADEHIAGSQRDEILEYQDARITQTANDALAAVRLAFELLEIPGTMSRMEEGLTELADKPFEVRYYDEYLGPHVLIVDYLSRSLDLIGPLIEAPSAMHEHRSILERMLRQIPYFIEGWSKAPKREKDVQDALEGVLRLAFPDVIREPPAPKQTKIYHPDFGIESIGTAIEIKFVADPSKAPLAIGSLYEDVQGYANSGYSQFIGLVYMAGNYLTQDQVDAELSKANVPKNWAIILVVGAIEPITGKSAAKA